MIWQFISIITYVLYITYTYWTLVDARVKKDEHFENKKKNVTWTPNNIFDFLNFHPFSLEGFFTVSIVVAHGVALHCTSALAVLSAALAKFRGQGRAGQQWPPRPQKSHQMLFILTIQSDLRAYYCI